MTKEIRYECPSCKVGAGVSVKLLEPPKHKCPKRANRVIELVPVNDKAPDNQSDD